MQNFNWENAVNALLGKSDLNVDQKEKAKKILNLTREIKSDIRKLETTFTAPDHLNSLKTALEDENDVIAAIASLGAKRTFKMHFMGNHLMNVTSEDESIDKEIRDLIEHS